MKLLVKTINNFKIELEVDPNITVLELKTLLKTKHTFSKDDIKLIFNGIVLKEDYTLNKYELKDEDFLIVLECKRNTPKSTNINTVKDEAKTISLNNDIFRQTLLTQSSINNQGNPLPTQSSINNQGNPLPTQTSINNQGNPLLTQMLMNNQSNPLLTQMLTNNLGNLRSIPNSQGNPLLTSMLMNTLGNLQSTPNSQGNPLLMHMLMNYLGNINNPLLSPELTEQEQEDIKQLMDLGYSEHIVKQAYLICGKNIELTANYLFEHNGR